MKMDATTAVILQAMENTWIWTNLVSYLYWKDPPILNSLFISADFGTLDNQLFKIVDYLALALVVE